MVRRVRPSQLLAAQMRHRDANSDEVLNSGFVDMASERGVSRAYEDLDKGRLITVLFKCAQGGAQKRREERERE
jgi:hypothetical protein